ncbi:MAG: nitroreductase family protein [Oscillospiraceae bacterium]|nr:nitroreductase family protein [Oscillospiraceae bacterium]
MELIKAITERRSIRKYTNQPVTQEDLQKIIQTAKFAPSWKNSQTARYYAILNPELKNQIAEQGTCDFSKNKLNIQNAPALIILTTVNGISGYEKDGSFTTDKKTHWQSFDAGIACQTFCLTAHEYGFGTLIMGIFDEKKIAEILNLPEQESISALIAIGYADETPVAPERKAVDEILQII